MKKILISIINFYQIFISGIIRQLLGVRNACRFEETCSDYAKKSILKYGAFKGLSMSFIRVLKCQPFYNGK